MAPQAAPGTPSPEPGSTDADFRGQPCGEGRTPDSLRSSRTERVVKGPQRGTAQARRARRNVFAGVSGAVGSAQLLGGVELGAI